jgi:formate hydrogenlyase subunit 3/multisubunit Na+/H+ antiporter MnhD subunit
MRFTLALGFDFLLRVDFLSLVSLSLSSVLWFLTTIYAIGYLEGSPNRSRFFGFFSLCVTACTGIAMAGNLWKCKWYLALGGLQAGKLWVVVILISSTLLNAAYFLPIVYAVWFKEPHTKWQYCQNR